MAPIPAGTGKYGDYKSGPQLRPAGHPTRLPTRKASPAIAPGRREPVRRAGSDAVGMVRLLRDGGNGRTVRPGQPCVHVQEQTTLPQAPASIRSKPFWKSSMAIWWVNTFCSGKPVSTIWVILYQVSYMRRP
jgi:hypothetical protein